MTRPPHPPRSPRLPRRIVAGAAALILTAALAVVGLESPAAAAPTVRANATPRDADIEAKLYNLMAPTLRLARDDDMRNLVYDMVSEQFDGDTDVLFDDFIARAEAQGRGFTTAAAWPTLKAAVAQFATLTGGTYRPQIFIPNFGVVDRAFRVTTGVAPQDESVLTTVGYQERAIFGTMRPIGVMDEAYLLSNEVWIMSINERQGMTAADIHASRELTAAAKARPRTAKAAGGFSTTDTSTPCNPSLQHNNHDWEYLEYVLIENPRKFEGVFQGGLDMRVMVFGATGVRGPTFDFGIGRTNSNWNSIGHLMTTWDRAIYGDLWSYIWLERDSGDTETVSYTVPNGGPTVSYTKTDKDDDMGSNNVNFTDLSNVEYTTGEVTSYVCGVGGDGNTGQNNFARTSRVNASSTYGSYSAAKTIDGDTDTSLGEPYSWANARYAPMPQWLSYDLGVPRTINRVVVYTTASYPIKDFDIRYWDDALGYQIAYSVRGNTAAVIPIDLPRSMTTRLVFMDGYSGPDHQPGYVRINEFELWA